MKTIIYKPSEVGFSGSIELSMPLYEERLELLDDMNIKINDDGTSSLEKDSSLKTFSKMLRAASKFYKNVDMIYDHEGQKEVYNSYEDLSCDSRCVGILRDVAMKVLNMGAVGNG